MRPADVDALVAGLADDPDVLGVVLLGSAAAPERADEWSDVDLWLVVRPGRADAYREDLSWLPGHERVVAVARETAHGRVVVREDGSVVELAVATLGDVLGAFRASVARVVLDRGGVGDAVRAVTVPAPSGPGPDDVARELTLLCGHLLVGVGRARRGELLSAGETVRSVAVAELLRALRARAGAGLDLLDPFDPRRRVERVLPEHAAALAAATRLEPEACGRRLLDLAQAWFGAEPGWPAAAADAVRRRFGWGPGPLAPAA